MENRQIDKNKNKQILVDVNIHQKLKEEAVRRKISIKKLVESLIIEFLEDIPPLVN